MSVSRRCFLGMLAMVVASCVRAANPCVVDPGGIGGTGSMAQEGGVGGTGIVGVITGFGSVCVGGIEIQYGSNTRIQFDATEISPSDLKVGHVVQVRADGEGDVVQATSIELLAVVKGPVSQLDVKRRRVQIMRQWVRVSPEFMDVAMRAAQDKLPLVVSGFRSARGDIVATRVDANPGLREFGVIGRVTSVTRAGARVGDLRIRFGAKAGTRPRPGQLLELCGTAQNGTLHAHSIEPIGTSAFDNLVQRIVLEGYVAQYANGRLRIDDTHMEMTAPLRAQIRQSGGLRIDEKVVVRLRVLKGKYVAERIDRTADTSASDGYSAPR